MINLKCRTEYSFRTVFGQISKVLAATSGPIGICDRGGTWGHVQFDAACKAAERKPIFGVEIAVVDNMKSKTKQGINYMSFLAQNNAGLQEIYELVCLSTMLEHSYYVPRIDYSTLFDVSDNVFILSGSNPVWGSLPRRENLFIELSPSSQSKAKDFADQLRFQTVAVSDNFYPKPSDKNIYEAITGREMQMRTSAMHLLSRPEWELIWPGCEQALKNSILIAEECNATLPRATLVKHSEGLPSLRELCESAAKDRNINLDDLVYRARLDRELDMIAEKEFDDYFYLVWDMIRYAKANMLVGPARGSSCGSLVCYLLSITEIDPIPYSLLFERFIDINRKDLPDIDIDFPDDRRELVFEYMRNKYGADNVARLGTVMRYKAKSAIDTIAKALNVPLWEVNNLKGSIIERSGGDSRAEFCIMDTFEQLDIGRDLLKKYPQMKAAGEIENHASGSGQHAAGIVVTTRPVSNFCSVNKATGAAQVDKHDAETLNLLKIDALGLRTLSVIQDCLDQIGWTREQIMRYPTNDKKAFAVINDRRFAGIFQFEGSALQSLCNQFMVEEFEDLASMTALARPGPLHSGAATEFIRRKLGDRESLPLHPLIAHTTEITHGVVIYQEQVMQIAREMGNLSWEDVSSLRKAMSKSLGKEYFDQYWARFKVGAAEHGINEDDALTVWNQINTMGSWSFNRSHAVAYGMVSYWCLVLKAHFPLEFSAACLRNAKDDDQCIKLLRELSKEGYEFRAFDPVLSQRSWSVQNGILIGGLTTIKGVGEKVATDIMSRRRQGIELSQAQKTKLANARTPFDMIFECQDRWGHLKKDPEKYGIISKLLNIEDIHESDEEVNVCFIGKIVEKDLRDLNDPTHIKKRNGNALKGSSLMVLFTAEDDTDQIHCMIDRRIYDRIGKPVIEDGHMGDWYIWKGNVKAGFRQVQIAAWKKLSGENANPAYAKTNELS